MSSTVDIRPAEGPLAASLYVHVPFCLVKCAYCDFHSAPLADEPELGHHFAWAAGEASAHWAALGALDDVESIYVGGGTPTTLRGSLVTLLEWVRASTHLRPNAEVTVETNPDTTERAIVSRLVGAGVNRFSLGVQSFDDRVLATLGRSHTAAAAREALELLVGTGARVSVDLMCGVPGQTLGSWHETLRCAVEAGVGHLSVYPLTLEAGTPLDRAVSAGGVRPPDDDLAAEMLRMAEDALCGAGLRRYEVASYARPGEESVHNTGYWTGRAYIGVGPSASSMLPATLFARAIACEAWSDPEVAGVGRTLDRVPEHASRVRFARSADTASFVRRPAGPPEDVEYLSEQEALAEDAMLGMRLAGGISDDLVAAAGVGRALDGLAARGLVEHVDRFWRVTDIGWLLGNEVFAEIWHAGSRRDEPWHSL